MSAGVIVGTVIGAVIFLAWLFLILPSIRVIGPTEVGLITKRFGKKLSPDNPIAFNGEAGYQAELLMPGWRFKFWIWYIVEKFPWVQVPAGEIGVVIAQVGHSLPIGAKSGKYVPEATIKDVREFVDKGGFKGVQRPVLPPGSLMPLHPVGFLVITKDKVYGLPANIQLVEHRDEDGRHGHKLLPKHFGLNPDWLQVTVIKPEPVEGKIRDIVGIVTTLEGDPLPSGDIAGRLGGFTDIEEAKAAKKTDAELIELIIGSKNNKHNNYQDFQAFLDSGGKIGLQHDPLLYGAYLLNPFLVKVDKNPMLIVEQGEVAVIKSYVGLPEAEGRVNATEFKFGALVRPGHRGIWAEPLKTGKYAINPHCYMAEIVPVSIITLSWADHVTKAHEYDVQLNPIDAKSREGFLFHIDLQVQIHIAAAEAPAVISMVGTMQNLITEVLQAAVGNHFRDKLQALAAVKFIETRQAVQEEASRHIYEKMTQYHVESKGVYIQDVILPPQLVEVLTNREIANQQIETYKKQEEAQKQRIAMEQQTGLADKQKELAGARVNVEIKQRGAEARKAEADGESTYLEQTNAATGIGKAKGYKEQIAALGVEGTTLVNVITALADKGLKFVPEIVAGGDSGLSGMLTALIAKTVSKKE